MDFKDFINFINKEYRRLDSLYKYSDKEKRVLAHTVKLSEEVGEFCNEILHLNKKQRKDKNKGSVEDEFADVVIVAFLAAKAAGVKTKEALKNRIKRINDRYRN